MVRCSSASGSARIACMHLARISPWLRWEPKIRSSGSERQAQSHHRRLLTDRQVRGAGVLILDAAERALRLDVAEHAFEGPDRHHVGVHPA